MSPKIEGTVILDGLVEGRAAEMGAVEPKLREWRAFVEKAGLRFSLEIDRNSFSLLAENAPVPVAKLSGNPGRIVTDALNELLKAFPADERRGVFSTVRSTEYRKGEEVQTLYSVSGDGTIRANERIVEAQTVAPEPAARWRERLMLGAVGLAAAVLILWLSSFFIDYRKSWDRFILSVNPPDVKSLKVEAAGFERWFTVSDVKASSHGAAVTLTLKRTADFPRTDAEAERQAKSAGDSAVARLAAEAVIRGRVCVRFYDKDNKLITWSEVLILPLRDAETQDLELTLPSERRAGRIVIAD